MRLTTDEQERLAYVSGDTTTAALLARIDTLQRYLGEATATLEAIADGGMTAKQAAGAAREGLRL
jgi:pentose-5-phosphate-3-epimerase